jgi:hypothetical protein
LKIKKIQDFIYKTDFFAIMEVALFCGLERAPTFLVPIINPPFADNSPHPPKGY